MSKLVRVLVFLPLFFAFTKADAASFDCQKAATFVEKTICQKGDISVLDEKLAQAYKSALQSTSAASVKQAQSQWMKNRNLCQTEDCVRASYETRLKELGSATPTASSGTLGSKTGTYKQKNATVSIVQKGNQIEFMVYAEWHSGTPGGVNVGQICGSASLSGNAAKYRAPEYDCSLDFSFQDKGLTVKQEGTCDFGMNVSAEGIYKKTSDVQPDLCED